MTATIDEKIDKTDEVIAAVEAYENAGKEVQQLGQQFQTAQTRFDNAERVLRAIVDRSWRRGWCIHVKGRVYFQSLDNSNGIESMNVVTHHGYEPIQTNGAVS